jgi:hypothetical protein
MNNTPFKVIWLKAAIAFLIPFLTTLGGSFALYELTGLPAHYWICLVVVICSSLVAGLSALSSFLSTSYSEHKSKQEAGLPDKGPAPITGAQLAMQKPAAPTQQGSAPTQPLPAAAQQ